ncbi:Histone-lysine N-methyltransferase ASHR3 [Acorus calamus]|uniref:Histone-lysine N-methyltransferase ASHR3 n=1 Tax=Acorus calamus TaxID=4465 RepID=A0AAV9CXB4_ACOCL|nr:Histone-lysine N-methyltransferase ASHR3 [Acorus calamus]
MKKKRDDTIDDSGCKSCKTGGTCDEDCVCRGQSISCSKACSCSDSCTNRPFRREKKVKIVKTRLCGWGVKAAESIKKGDFVIEYIGEVINDALCEQRLWDMKHRGDQNFYMCEIRKDFTIDATFKGNASRFLNHSCNPNCKLEKWQVDGETRVGVFAAQAIEAGEQLTYDYRYWRIIPVMVIQMSLRRIQLSRLSRKQEEVRQRETKLGPEM